MNDKIKEIIIPAGRGVEYVVEDVTPDDVDCIMESNEAWRLCDWLNRCGPPLKFKSVEELEEMARNYFENCATYYRPLTITGLALGLGTFPDVLLDYERGKYGKEYCEPMRRLRNIVIEGYEHNLHGPNATGSIFALKNFGWHDTTAHELSGPGGKPIAVTRSDGAELKDFSKEDLKKLLESMPEK